VSLDDDLRATRARLAEAADLLTRAGDEDDEGAPFLLCKTSTIAGPYPTAVLKFYAVELVTLSGPEVEGGAVTVTGTGVKFLAANAGKTVPPLGTVVRVYRVPHRFAFSYNGPTS
jgi:hypothetical protein